MMASIRGKDTKPELDVRRALHALGFRYRLHAKDLPGKPDVVLPRYKAAILIHGCFWHRHAGCRFATTPATRPEFWAEKFAQNILRDQRNAAGLGEAGWRVATVWECTIRTHGGQYVAEQIARWLRSDEDQLVI